MQQYYTFDQLVEQLPEICKEQRRFLQLTQADVVERLEKETGVRKDQSKISMFESGKIAIPDFLSDYCSILDIRFPAPSYRKEYLMEKKDVTKKLDAKEMSAEKITFIKKVVKKTMRDMGYKYELDDNKDIQIHHIDEYYCAKASIPMICRDATVYLTDNLIFAFKVEDDMPKLCGRVEIYAILPVAYMTESIDSEIMLYFDKQSDDLRNLAQQLQIMIKELMFDYRKQKLEKQNNNFESISLELFNALWKHRAFLMKDIYVYKSDQKKGCFSAIMKYVDRWLGFGDNTTWICNPAPIYLEGNDGQYKKLVFEDPDNKTFIMENLENIKILIINNFATPLNRILQMKCTQSHKGKL